MRFFRSLAALIIVYLIALPYTAAAQTASPVPGLPIKVNACNPHAPTESVPGYVPAYYPYGGLYYWNDVYGYRYTQPPIVSDPILSIHYKNVAPVTAKSIEFGLIARGELVAEVKDVGTFSPNTEIKHKFGLSPNVWPLQTALVKCIPLRVTFENGTTWRNPHLPVLRRQIYGPAAGNGTR